LELSHEEHSRRIEILVGLSPSDIAERRNGLGASEANIILGGDEEKLLKLWREKLGLEEPEDLSDVLAVQMGAWTEDLNLRWFEKQTGCRVFGRKTKVQHPTLSWLRSTMDGRTTLQDGRNAVVEAKHVGPFNYSLDAVVARYLPQLTVQMTCCECDVGVFTVFSGSNKWEHKVVELDAFYQARVIGALRTFWQHVQDKTPPVVVPEIAAPVPVALMRKLDYSTNNEWISWEEEYNQTQEVHARHAEAKKQLNLLIPDDCSEVTGRFVVAKRSKTGAVTIRKKKGA
jgi:predicted phage-related endonuclease